MFEIEMLWKNGVDVTSQIDQEKPFSDEDSSELISYLSKIFSLPEEEIVFEPEEDDEDPDWPYK